MKQFLKFWFDLNHSERKGLFFLISILLLLIAAKIIFPYLNLKEREADFRIITYSQDIDRQLIALKDEKKVYENHYKTYPKREYQYSKKDFSKTYKLFYFDPNNLPAEKWMQLGLSEKQAHSLIKFEQKNGPFRTKEDLKKVFVISDEFYARVEPYIRIDEEKLVHQKINQKANIEIFDLNLVDTSQLMRIKLIDSALAVRIIKFRNSVGNFYSVEQLRDIWGINEFKYNKIQKHFKIENAELKKLNLNYCTQKDLSTLPYFDYKTSNKIIRHRESKGFFKKISDLVELELIDQDLFEKVAPYLYL